MAAILPENVGFLVMIGVGLVMALTVTLMVKAETKWLGTRKTSEWFYTAGRTIKTGLIAASIVSAWTWAATLLQSSTVTFEFGVAGSFWYAAGACIQVILFSILAVELKRRAPMTHTFAEMINVRYGRHAHKVFLLFGLMTNTLVTAMLVLGGAAVVNSLTGVDITLAAFLLPVGIVLYTIFGGLKATFFAEYINAGFIFVVVLAFVSVIYFVSPDIGGISGMYDKLSAASILNPVEGNAMGSYLTLASAGALVFGVINIVGNFGTVFVDQSYWQRAIAARSRSVVGGFIIGGLVWFAIPFTLATTLGLAAIATGVTLSEDQIGLGLVAPTAAAEIMGDVGAILILAIVFTAVTAAGSSQLVSVSSLMTYDVFRTYLKPSATGRELMRVSRYAILLFGAGMGLMASMLFQLGVSLQYVYLMMGILIGSAVAPISLSILWGRTNRNAATAAAVTGLVAGVGAWLGSASAMYGEISILSTGSSIPLLAGNVASILTGLIVTVVGSIMFPERFDFRDLKQRILLADDRIRSMLRRDADERRLARMSALSKRIGLGVSVFLVIVWPASLYLTEYVFTESSFTAWVVMAVVWAAAGAMAVIALPILEARRSVREIASKIFGAGGREDPAYARRQHDEAPHGTVRARGADAAEAQSLLRVLVPVDGSISSLRALNNANRLLRDVSALNVYLLYVMEWADEDDAGGEEDMDEQLSNQMREEGRIVLRSVSVPQEVHSCTRIVKLGAPAKKIAETADRLNVDLVAMGRRGLGGTDEPMGHVTMEVIGLTQRPVVLLD